MAAAMVAGCAPDGQEANALVIGATIFTERAELTDPTMEDFLDDA